VRTYNIAYTIQYERPSSTVIPNEERLTVTDFLHLGAITSEENLKGNTCLYAFYYVYISIYENPMRMRGEKKGARKVFNIGLFY